MRIIGICNIDFHLVTQTVAPTLPYFQGLHFCILYLDNHSNNPVFYPYNSYDVSNIIRPTYRSTQDEDYTTHNSLEFRKYNYYYIINNRRRSVSDIMHTLIVISILCKVQIQPSLASDSTDVEIRYMYKAVKNTK